MLDDAEIVLTGFGTAARIAKSVVDKARAEGIKAGLIRPITLWPFPSEIYARAAENADKFLCVEMSMGQMIEDVKLAVNGKKPVHFYGRSGGMVPLAKDVLAQVKKLMAGGAE
ncbi:hypothetical protein N752_24635 [Desulforamulus aquiferis]|nr:hypothetical protein N752_24635 [Desulforamulus aquiferis]